MKETWKCINMACRIGTFIVSPGKSGHCPVCQTFGTVVRRAEEDMRQDVDDLEKRIKEVAQAAVYPLQQRIKSLNQEIKRIQRRKEELERRLTERLDLGDCIANCAEVERLQEVIRKHNRQAEVFVAAEEQAAVEIKRLRGELKKAAGDHGVSLEQWERLRLLCDTPHEHYEGQNECAICDKALCDKALVEDAADRIEKMRGELSQLRGAVMTMIPSYRWAQLGLSEKVVKDMEEIAEKERQLANRNPEAAMTPEERKAITSKTFPV